MPRSDAPSPDATCAAQPSAASLARWRELDQAHASNQLERDALGHADGTRAAVLARQLDAAPDSTDSATAWYEHGRRLAELGVSAAACYRSARHGQPNAARACDATVAHVLDGFAARQRELFDEARCARAHELWIRTGARTAALCFDVPSEDPEWLAQWAELVVRQLVRAGVRTLQVRLPDAATTALRQAGELVDVAVEPAAAAASPDVRRERGFWRHFRR